MTNLAQQTLKQHPAQPEVAERPLVDVLRHMRRKPLDTPMPARRSEPYSRQSPWTVTLANTFDLRCRVVQARWYARQSGASALTAIYDDLNGDLDLLADLLGQRILAAGGQPNGLAPHIARESSLPPQRLAIIGRDSQISTVTVAIAGTLRQLATSIDTAHTAGDQAMVEILQRLQRRLTNRKAALAQLLDKPAA